MGEDESMVLELEDEQVRARRRDTLQLFGARLQSLVDSAVSAKSDIETRWLADIRQWRGEYDPETISMLKAQGRSQAFVNLTRVKCNAAESRLAEMLMPTDDRNWDIRPTPIPQSVVAEDAAVAAQLMRQKMADALEECDYNAQLRDVIHNAVVLGTGVLKGPVIRNRFMKQWQRDEAGISRLSFREDITPAAESISPWDVFVDTDARDIQEAEWVIERHRMTRQQLRDLARLPASAGFLSDAIAELLESDARKRQMSGEVDSARSSDNRGDGRFEVWEYHGEIAQEDLISAGVEIDENPLEVYQGIVWFCHGVVIKAIVNPLDTGEKPYSFFVWEKDDSSPFGFGVPAMCRDSQRVCNAAWRMLLDNASMSVMPQVVVNSAILSPRDGSWVLRPGKVWELQQQNVPVNAAFGVFPVQSNLGELVNLFSMAQRFVDDETGLPQIAQGQQGPTVTKTAQGMGILMNSANTVVRRLVRQFDECITRPFLMRLYDWFMQFDDDESAKGDCEIVPLGSSSLLVREQQTDGLLKLLQLSQSNPTLSEITKVQELYRKLVQSMNINADGLILSDDEIKSMQQNKQAGPPQQDPKIMLEQQRLQLEQQKLQAAQQQQQIEMQMDAQRLAADQQIAARELALREAEAESEAQMALLKMQTDSELTAAEIESARQQTAMTLDSKHQLFNAEAALRMQTGAGI